LTGATIMPFIPEPALAVPPIPDIPAMGIAPPMEWAWAHTGAFCTAAPMAAPLLGGSGPATIMCPIMLSQVAGQRCRRPWR
jgi:hypothetical protein